MNGSEFANGSSGCYRFHPTMKILDSAAEMLLRSAGGFHYRHIIVFVVFYIKIRKKMVEI